MLRTLQGLLHCSILMGLLLISNRAQLLKNSKNGRRGRTRFSGRVISGMRYITTAVSFDRTLGLRIIVGTAEMRPFAEGFPGE